MDLFAQSVKVSLSGTIQDAKSGETLPFVVVNIKDLNLWTTSDINGKFSFKNVKKGEYTLTASCLGYKDYEVCSYIFREIIQISIIGVILGIPSGILILYLIMKFLDFGSLSDIKLISYFLTGVLVITFIIIVDLLLIRKIKKVNMNDSLKSLE